MTHDPDDIFERTKAELARLRLSYPDLSVRIVPHGTTRLPEKNKPYPHTDLRAWQARVFPERPLLTGPAARYEPRKNSDQAKSDRSMPVDPPPIVRTEECINSPDMDADQATRKKERYADPDGYEWHGPEDYSALSGLPCSHVHHAPSKDYIRHREARGRKYDGLRLMIATTRAENLTLSNSPAVCLQESRLRVGKHFRRRFDAGETELQGPFEAIRKQYRDPETPCPCSLCLAVTPTQRRKDIEASGRVQKPLPAPYGAKKRVSG